MADVSSPARTSVIYDGSFEDYRGMEFVATPCICNRRCLPGRLVLRHYLTNDVVLRHVRPTSVFSV